MKAKLVIITARNRTPAASTAAAVDVLAQLAPLDRKLDDQDAILGGERDQHHQSDLRIDVDAVVRPMPPRRCADDADATESNAGIGMFQLS